jgi:hypothetical protein
MDKYKLAWIFLEAKANAKVKALMAECLKMAEDKNLISEISAVVKEGENK